MSVNDYECDLLVTISLSGWIFSECGGLWALFSSECGGLWTWHYSRCGGLQAGPYSGSEGVWAWLSNDLGGP